MWRETSEAKNPDYQFCLGNVLGCIGSDGVGRLVLCTQTVNAPYYCEIIHNNLT